MSEPTASPADTSYPVLDDHPIAGIFPLMSNEEIVDLAEDIKAHGLEHPIGVHEGQILDGRNRYRALRLLASEPGSLWPPLLDPTLTEKQLWKLQFPENTPMGTRVFEEPFFDPYDEEKTPVDYVVSQNLRRRHLTTSQRAAVAVGLKPMYAAQLAAKEAARKRQEIEDAAADAAAAEDQRKNALVAGKASARGSSDHPGVTCASDAAHSGATDE